MTKVIFVDNEPVCPQCGDPNMLIEIDFGTKLLDGVCFYPDFGWDYRLNCDIDGEDKALHCRECDFKVDIEDVEALIRAEALDGLHFDLLEPDQRVRLAKTVARAADGLRLSLSSSDSDDPRDAEFAEYLSVLEMRLHDLFE